MTTTPVAKEETPESDDSGIGGDEPFCAHGNLLWSEDCDECSDEQWAITEAISGLRPSGEGRSK